MKMHRLFLIRRRKSRHNICFSLFFCELENSLRIRLEAQKWPVVSLHITFTGDYSHLNFISSLNLSQYFIHISHIALWLDASTHNNAAAVDFSTNQPRSTAYRNVDLTVPTTHNILPMSAINNTYSPEITLTH